MSWKRLILFSSIIVVLTLAIYPLVNPMKVLGSCCSIWPTGETTASEGGDQTYWSITNYEMTLSGSISFYDWPLKEYQGQQGDDGCWTSGVNEALVPEFPEVNGTPWTVDSGNTWGYDQVGWYPASVTYIRQHAAPNGLYPQIPIFPCGADVYQLLLITCPGDGTLDQYEPVVHQTETVEQGDVKNSRAGVYDSIPG